MLLTFAVSGCYYGCGVGLNCCCLVCRSCCLWMWVRCLGWLYLVAGLGCCLALVLDWLVVGFGLVGLRGDFVLGLVGLTVVGLVVVWLLLFYSLLVLLVCLRGWWV